MDRGAWCATVHGVTESGLTVHACTQPNVAHSRASLRPAAQFQYKTDEFHIRNSSNPPWALAFSPNPNALSWIPDFPDTINPPENLHFAICIPQSSKAQEQLWKYT